MSDSPQSPKPAQSAIGAISKLLKSGAQVLFGSDDNDQPAAPPGAAALAQASPHAEDGVRTRAPQGGALLPARLKAAFASFDAKQRDAYFSHVAPDTECFQITRLILVCPDGSAPALAEFTALAPTQRANLVKAIAKDFPLFDMTQFVSASIEEQAEGNGSLETLFSSDEPMQAKIWVEFVGEIVAKRAPVVAAAAPTATHAPASRAQVATVLPPPSNPKRSQTATVLPPGSPAPTPICTLLVQDASGNTEVPVYQLPFRVGRDESVEFSINNEFLSREQLTFSFDAAGRLQVTHRGTSTTTKQPVPNVGQAADTLGSGTSVVLTGRTLLTLAPASSSPVRIEVVLPLGHPASPSPTPPAPTPLAPTPLVPVPVASPPALVPGSRRSAPTLLAPVPAPPASPRPPLAILALRYANGHIQRTPIAELPFDIGRNALAQSASACDVDEQCALVSRVHLRLISHEGSQFAATNPGGQSGGTWKNGQAMPPQFSLQAVAAETDLGWLALGGAALDEQTVQMRLEQCK